jgi:hypothetical protein
MQPTRTSKEPHPFFKLSTWIIIIPSSVVNVDHHHHPFFSCQRGSSSSLLQLSTWIHHHLVLLWYLCFLLVYPLAATPLFPHVSLFRRKACLSVHHRDFPLVDAVMGCRCVHAIHYSHHRVSPDLSAMASPTLAVDPSDTASRE